jgi:hypothetical protein
MIFGTAIGDPRDIVANMIKEALDQIDQQITLLDEDILHREKSLAKLRLEKVELQVGRQVLVEEFEKHQRDHP